eukprot:g15645.t1
MFKYTDIGGQQAYTADGWPLHGPFNVWRAFCPTCNGDAHQREPGSDWFVCQRDSCGLAFDISKEPW